LRRGARTTTLALIALLPGACAADGKVATRAEKDSGTTAAEPTAKAAATPVTGQAAWDFQSDQPGLPPGQWLIAQTNPTVAPATWRVMTDSSAPKGANVLALTESKNHDGTFNLAIAQRTSFGNLDLIVRAKAVSGTEDQGGGPIWRCRDENNYYICRFNPLENNFRVYVVKDGRRRQLATAPVQLAANRWYQVGVLMIGNTITCWLDGQELLHATDDTFTKPGMVGLWTKADAVTSFDDLAVREPRGK
jgi:hypothetical protein